jgi:hypothetical protein
METHNKCSCSENSRKGFEKNTVTILSKAMIKRRKFVHLGMLSWARRKRMMTSCSCQDLLVKHTFLMSNHPPWGYAKLPIAKIIKIKFSFKSRAEEARAFPKWQQKCSFEPSPQPPATNYIRGRARKSFKWL